MRLIESAQQESDSFLQTYQKDLNTLLRDQLWALTKLALQMEELGEQGGLVAHYFDERSIFSSAIIDLAS
jgi:hypothetical protein